MSGALLFGLSVAAFFGAGFAVMIRGSMAAIDTAVTLPDPRRPHADDDTTRIEPTNIRDLPRHTRSWTA